MSESCCNTHHHCLQTLGTKKFRLIKLLKGNVCHLYFVLHREKKKNHLYNLNLCSERRLLADTKLSKCIRTTRQHPTGVCECDNKQKYSELSATLYSSCREYELRPKLLCSAIYSIQFRCRRKGYITDN